MKNQKSIDEQIQALENELTALDAKREALQARIIKLKSTDQTIADEQFPYLSYKQFRYSFNQANAASIWLRS